MRFIAVLTFPECKLISHTAAYVPILCKLTLTFSEILGKATYIRVYNHCKCRNRQPKQGAKQRKCRQDHPRNQQKASELVYTIPPVHKPLYSIIESLKKTAHKDLPPNCFIKCIVLHLFCSFKQLLCDVTDCSHCILRFVYPVALIHLLTIIS